MKFKIKNSKIYKMILPFVLFFTLFIIVFSLYGFWSATHPPKYKTNLTPQDFEWSFQAINLTTIDNIRLSAWFVPAEKNSDKTIILLHGYPFDKANILGWASFLHDDFNLLFFDFRYFGDSEGSMTTVGYHEQKDLASALDYLEKRSLPDGGQGFDRIGIMGFSLGGAVAIMTAAKDTRINAVVSDSAYANLDLVINEYYQNLFVFKYPLSSLTKIWAKIFVGVYPSEISPQASAKNLQIPILIIHSKKDQVIPFENATRIKDSLKNNPRAEFLFQEEGVHGGLPEKLRQEYQEKVLKFLNKNI